MTLDRAPLETPLVLISLNAAPAQQQRLASLGLRPGVRLSLLQRIASGGRIVSVGGGRVAVGRVLLASLVAEVAEVAA